MIYGEPSGDILNHEVYPTRSAEEAGLETPPERSGRSIRARLDSLRRRNRHELEPPVPEAELHGPEPAPAPEPVPQLEALEVRPPSSSAEAVFGPRRRAPRANLPRDDAALPHVDIPMEEANEACSRVRPAVHQAIKRLHTNLGHPTARVHSTMIRLGNGTKEAMEAAMAFRCPVCERQRQVQARPVAKPPVALIFNHALGMDVMIIPDFAGTAHPFFVWWTSPPPTR